MGYLSFKEDKCRTNFDNVSVNNDGDIAKNDTNKTESSLSFDENTFKNDISTSEELRNLWEKLQGYWINVGEYFGDDFCSGSFLRLHYERYDSITFGKFSSEFYVGNILSIEKIANNKFKFYIVEPIKIGYEKAIFNEYVLDTSEISKNVLKFAYCDGCDFDTYKYVAKDINFGDDDMTTYFCKWNKNH